MKTIKAYIFNHFKVLFILSSFISVSIFLLMIRLKITHSFFYIFLVWNLFLAVIPFCISSYLKSKKIISTKKLILGFGAWLLFLPNAPYLVTDLIHLRLGHPYIIWFDTIMIALFAICGLLLFYFSIKDMKQLLRPYLKNKYLNIAIISLFFLASFGVYLGRFLRYNSWEILSQPLNLLNDIFEIIILPSQHLAAWLFTFGFGLFLWIGFWLFKNLYSKPST